MKFYIIFLLISFLIQPLSAQDSISILSKFYVGASYGRAIALGDFHDTDINNPDAGFAQDGDRIEIYGGYFLNEKVVLKGTFRYQTFDTEIDQVVNEFNQSFPETNFSGNTENWRAYYLLLGAAYEIKLSEKFKFFPGVAFGPMIATTPGLNVSSVNTENTQNFSRSSETGWGIGFEVGLGLQRDIGKHFSLMPTFTYSVGYATINDVVTTTDNVSIMGNYDAKIQSFNLGFSLAYRFY